MSILDDSNEDVDLEQLIALLDKALESDDPRIKKALKNFLMVASLIDSEEDEEKERRGPFSNLLSRIENIEYKLEKMPDPSIQNERDKILEELRKLDRTDYKRNTYPPNINDIWINDNTNTRIDQNHSNINYDLKNSVKYGNFHSFFDDEYDDRNH